MQVEETFEMAQQQVVEPVVQQEAVVTREFVEPVAAPTYMTQPAVTTVAAPPTIIGGATQYVSGGYAGGTVIGGTRGYVTGGTLAGGYAGGTVIGGAARPIVSSYG